jgi:hypothetical protein
MYVLENLLKFRFFKFLSHFIVKCGNFDNFKPKFFVLVHVILIVSILDMGQNSVSFDMRVTKIIKGSSHPNLV